MYKRQGKQDDVVNKLDWQAQKAEQARIRKIENSLKKIEDEIAALEEEILIDRHYESDIINEKYDFIEEIIREVLVNKDRQDALTEKVDRVLTHKFWSIPIFLVVMAAVFFLTFTIGAVSYTHLDVYKRQAFTPFTKSASDSVMGIWLRFTAL